MLVIHGPNLNMLGQRERDLYGDITLDALNTMLKDLGSKLGVEVESYQSNIEGEIVTKIQSLKGKCDAIVINPAAYTHTSIAIRDALLACGVPTVEVHLTNIQKREEFRRHSYISDIVLGTITGFGPLSYLLGLWAASELSKGKKTV